MGMYRKINGKKYINMYKEWLLLCGRIILFSLGFLLYFLIFYNKHIVSYNNPPPKKQTNTNLQNMRGRLLSCCGIFNFRILPQTYSPGRARSCGSSWEECDPALPRGSRGHEVRPLAWGNPGSFTVPEYLRELSWLLPAHYWSRGLWELQLCLLWDNHVKQGITSQQARYDLGDW